jgi:hypothetical protein
MDKVQARALLGAWRLLSWENRAADGQVTYPIGTDALDRDAAIPEKVSGARSTAHR